MQPTVVADVSADELPPELRFHGFPLWVRYGGVLLSIVAGWVGGLLAGGLGAVAGLTVVMAPLFTATLVRRRREVRAMIARVEAMSPQMSRLELAALIRRLEEHWEQASGLPSTECEPLRELLDRRAREPERS